MSLAKKIDCKGTWRQVFYLSEPPSPLTPYSPPDPILPPYTLYSVYENTVYLFTQGRGESGEVS
jgi:hypothetical protein